MSSSFSSSLDGTGGGGCFYALRFRTATAGSHAFPRRWHLVDLSLIRTERVRRANTRQHLTSRTSGPPLGKSTCTWHARSRHTLARTEPGSSPLNLRQTWLDCTPLRTSPVTLRGFQLESLSAVVQSDRGGERADAASRRERRGVRLKPAGFGVGAYTEYLHALHVRIV